MTLKSRSRSKRQGSDRRPKRKWGIGQFRRTKLGYLNHLDVCIIVECSTEPTGQTEGPKVVANKPGRRQNVDTRLCAVRHRGQQKCESFVSFQTIINSIFTARVGVCESSLVNTRQVTKSH